MKSPAYPSIDRAGDRSHRGATRSPRRPRQCIGHRGEKIKAACPTTIALTASGRLASMQQRIEAMIAGVATVQPPLDKFYGLVNDEQKARLNAVAEDQESKTSRRGNRSLARACDMTQPSALKWPADEIEARLRPTDAQRADLDRAAGSKRQGRRHAEPRAGPMTTSRRRRGSPLPASGSTPCCRRSSRCVPRLTGSMRR